VKEVTLMAIDKDDKTSRVKSTGHDVKDDLLQDVGLLALPVLAFQRNMLKLVKKGVEEAGLLHPMRTLLEHEVHALFMILDPKAKWRNSLGVEIEDKMKEALDRAVPKVISGSINLIDAQYEILTKLIDTLETARKSQTKNPKDRK
jgi:hypothetical protein